MYREIFLLTVLLAIADSKPKRVRIVGGKQSVLGEYPSLVAIFMKSSDLVFCGGTLISYQHVASAAHCFVEDIKPNDIYIIAGEKNLLRPAETRREAHVEDIISHPGFNKFDNSYDYALVVLTYPVEANEHIEPVKLSKRRPTPGTKCTVTGWGLLEQDGARSEQAMKADVYVSLVKYCEKLEGIDDETMFCAGVPEGESGDACKGDSGGPLYCNGELAGIVSWGIKCAAPGYPGVYADVSAERYWFDQLIASIRSIRKKGKNQSSV